MKIGDIVDIPAGRGQVVLASRPPGTYLVELNDGGRVTFRPTSTAELAEPNTTPTVDDELATAKIVEKLAESFEAWRSGRLPSPDEKDHVLATEDVLGIELRDSDREAIADELHELAAELPTVADMAVWLRSRVNKAWA